jgi:hypothetical protein
MLVVWRSRTYAGQIMRNTRDISAALAFPACFDLRAVNIAVIVVIALGAALAVVSVGGTARAADHGDAPLIAGTLIPGTNETLDEIGVAYVDGGFTVFEGVDSTGAGGFVVMKSQDPLSIKFRKTPIPLGKAAFSAPSFAFLADDGGVPTIFGIGDVENGDWATRPVLVKVGSELIAGWKVSELGDFALEGEKLVVVAKKVGGEAIFGLPDFEGGDPLFIVGTGTPTPSLGDITAIKKISTDGRKILFHAWAEDGEGVYLTNDFSANGFAPIAQQGEVIPKLVVEFKKFGQVDWNGKKAIFGGGDDGLNQGIYFDDGSGTVGVIADTNSPWLVDPRVFFTGFEGFSVGPDGIVYVANASDGTRSAYLAMNGDPAKRLLSDGDMLKAGVQLASFEISRKAVGSLVATGILQDGSTALVLANQAPGVPTLRSFGLGLLLIVAVLAVALAGRARRVSTAT